MRNVSEKICRENQNTFFLNHAIYDKVEKQCTAGEAGQYGVLLLHAGELRLRTRNQNM